MGKKYVQKVHAVDSLTNTLFFSFYFTDFAKDTLSKEIQPQPIIAGPVINKRLHVKILGFYLHYKILKLLYF